MVQPYLFDSILNLADRFKAHENPRRQRIGEELCDLAEIVKAAEKLERQECGWTEQEVIELILSLRGSYG